MTIKIEVVSGAEGPSLQIVDENGGYRLAGPKPWGGGTVMYSFEVDPSTLIRETECLMNAEEVELDE